MAAPCLLLLLGGLGSPLGARADALAAMQVLREGGCGGTMPPSRALRHVAALDRAAEEWANGRPPAQSTQGLHIKGPDSAAIKLLKHAKCAPAALDAESVHLRPPLP